MMARLYDISRNFFAIGLVMFFYMAVRSVSSDNFADAFLNAERLLNFQTSLGLPSETVLQSSLLRHLNVAKFFNTYYMFAHFVGTTIFMVIAYVWDRKLFGRVRDMLIGVTVVGGLIHTLYPLAPPRMMGGFIDFGRVIGPDPYESSVSGFANQIAAMPSLHVAWAIIVSFGVFNLLKSRIRWAGWVHAALTAVVVVSTGNHYWLDVAVAIGLAALMVVIDKHRLFPTKEDALEEISQVNCLLDA